MNSQHRQNSNKQPIAVGFDCNNYIAAAWHATQGEGNRTASGLFLDFYKSFITRVRPVHVLAAFDSPRNLYFRRKIYGPYKAKREDRPQDLEHQLLSARTALESLGVQCVSIEEFEADDILATYARKAAERNWKSIITSTDKDLFQVLRCGIVALYRKLPGVRPEFDVGNVFTEENFVAEYGMEVKDWVKYLSLAGNSGDGWPGAKGIGDVTARKIIKKASIERRHLATLATFDFDLAIQIVSLRTDCPFEIREANQGDVDDEISL